MTANTKSSSQRKTPEQLVRLAQRALVDLFDEEFHESSASTAGAGAGAGAGSVSPAEELCTHLSQLKVILYGGTTDGDKSEVDEEKAEEVSRRIQEEGLMLQLIDKLDAIPFEVSGGHLH
jgi:hypothetical protein